MSKQEVLRNCIESLRNAVPDLKGVLLASSEGLPIAYSLANDGDPNRLAAMAAAALNLGNRISEAVETGAFTEVNVRGSEGSLFVYTVGNKAVLAVVGPKNSNAGLIHLEARSTSSEIAGLFGG